MGPLNNGSKNSGGQAPRRPRNGRSARNVYTTKSGTDIRVNRSFSERRRARQDAMARQRAARLSTLPHNRFKRLMYRMHPRRLAAYWFSREGGIMALKISGIGIVVCFLLLVGLFAYFRKDLPNLKDVSQNQQGSITYYDRTGTVALWQDYNAVKRIPVPYEGMNDYIRNATIAIEDKDFYSEGAFNVRGIMRAAVDNAMNKGGPRQGGSTITQQLVKLNLNWTNDRTYTRKIKELILAVELEREYSKNDIITGYLNSAPYGGIEVGVESAARDYFHKGAKDLTLAEAVMLAAIPQAPAYYSPYNTATFEEDLLVGRMHYIIDRMVEQKMVTQKEADEAKKIDVVATVKPLQHKFAGIKAPYFVQAAKAELNSSYLGGKNTNRGGWKVITTLDMELQALAEKQVADGMPKVRTNKGDAAAFVATDVKTGEIVAATVGGSDFVDGEYGQLNFASDVQVSPGSSVKPYDYAAFIDKSSNVGAGSVLYDSQHKLPGYNCTDKRQPKFITEPDVACLWNYDLKYPGPLTLRYSLGGSRNVPAVKAMLSVGTNKTIDVMNGLMAKDKAYLCFEPGTDVFSAQPKDASTCYGSAALGDGAYLHLDDHVNGLASLSRLGKAVKKTYISKIMDAENKPVELHKREAKQVIRPDSAYIVNDMAADPRASYLPNSNACTGPCKFHNYNGWKFAIKTGTTNDGFDGLMGSWSTRYAAVAWVGHHTRTKTLSGTMESMTGPIVRNWMHGAHDKAGKAENWEMPKGVKTLPAYVVRTHVGVGSIEPSPATDLYPSWYQPKNTSNASATIDRVSNKRATDCTPEAAKQFVTNSNANNFSVDQFFNNGNGSGGATGAINTNVNDDIHNCNDQKPAIDLTVSSNGSGNPTTTCDSDGCTITATVSKGTHPLASERFPGKLTISIDGRVARTFDITNDSSPQTFSHSYTPDKDGTIPIAASVTDSVLYTGSASTSVAAQGGGGGNDGGNDDEGGGDGGGGDGDDGDAIVPPGLRRFGRGAN